MPRLFGLRARLVLRAVGDRVEVEGAEVLDLEGLALGVRAARGAWSTLRPNAFAWTFASGLLHAVTPVVSLMRPRKRYSALRFLPVSGWARSTGVFISTLLLVVTLNVPCPLMLFLS